MGIALGRPRTGGVLVLALALALLPLFLPNAYYFEVAANAAINAFVVVGLNLLIGYAGLISLGHAGFFAIGAYAVAILPTRWEVPTLAAIPIGAALAGLVAFAVGRPILRLRGHYLAMATLGFGMLIALVANNERELTGGPDGMTVPTLVVFGERLRGAVTWYWIAAVMLVLGTWLALNLIDSPTGRALRALHDSEVAAEGAAIDVARYKLTAFVVSAVFASLGGSMLACFARFVSPAKAGFLYSIELVTMTVLGGMGSTFGGILGAAVLTVLPQFLTLFHEYEHAILGLILMVCLIFLREGLVPGLLRRLGRER